MTFDLATIPADLLETDTASADEAANPTAEPAAEAAAAQPEVDATDLLATRDDSPASYPRDVFVHSLFGSFIGMPELPFGLRRDTIWDNFLRAYSSPDLAPLFADVTFPKA
jgi:hypothetical protein